MLGHLIEDEEGVLKSENSEFVFNEKSAEEIRELILEYKKKFELNKYDFVMSKVGTIGGR